MNEDLNQQYKVFGGWLLVCYWCLIIGGVLTLLTMALPALLVIAVSFLTGFVYAIGKLISIASTCVAAVFYIKSAMEMKARKPQFFDTFLYGAVISLGGGVLSGLLTIRSAYGIGSFIGTTIGSVIGLAIGLCLSVMYFSKSVRVNVYFEGRPLQKSRYWNWIKILPEFIISDAMPDPSKIQQLGSNPQQTGDKPQETPLSPAAQDDDKTNP